MSVRKVVVLIAVALIIFAAARIAAASGANPQAYEAVRQVLATIPSGRETLDTLQAYAVAVTFKTGQGSTFKAGKNLVTVDAGHEPVRAALSLVHEASHARVFHQGRRADIGQAAATYVSLRVQEEAEGVVASIEAKQALAAAGLDVSQVRYPLEKAYLAAYEAALAAGQTAQAAAEAGRAAVVEGFLAGRVLTSNTGETYPDYYQRCWAKADTARQWLGPISQGLLDLATRLVAESC